MARKGCRTGKRYGTGLMGRTQELPNVRIDVNLMVYLKLWLPLDENKGGPIFRKVLVTLDLLETRHKSIRLPNNTIWNHASFFYFFNIFVWLRSTKEVTPENLSLNKWKTWPAEFSEDCEKCEKTSRGENSNFGAEFGDYKIVKPHKWWGQTDPKNFSDRFWYLERCNRSSYAKVMAVLRTDSELEDKTVRKWEKIAAVARNWWKRWAKTHKLDSYKT